MASLAQRRHHTARRGSGHSASIALAVLAAGGLALLIGPWLGRLTWPAPGIAHDWWKLDFPMNGTDYRLLFHLQDGRLYRLKFEQVEPRGVFLVCEYFQEPSRYFDEPAREVAQRYKPVTGRYAYDVPYRRDFRVLSERIVEYSRTSDRGLLTPRFRYQGVVVALAKRALSTCLAPLAPADHPD